MTKGQTSNKGSVWQGAELVSVLAITWSEKTLSGLETGPGLCAVTENRDADRDTSAILCQRYSNTVCCSNESWHQSLSLGVFSACSCRTVLPRHHDKTHCPGEVPAAPFCPSARVKGPKDNLSQSKFGLRRRSALTPPPTPWYLATRGDQSANV